jgi:hypothetical protein
MLGRPYIAIFDRLGDARIRDRAALAIFSRHAIHRASRGFHVPLGRHSTGASDRPRLRMQKTVKRKTRSAR